MKHLLASAAVAALFAVSSPAFATGIGGQDQSQGQNQGQTQGQTAYGGTGVGIGKGGDAYSQSGAFSGSSSKAAAGAAAVGVNSNSAGASSAGQSASQSVQGDKTQYDSFAFGYAAPGLSIHNNGVYGDGTVTTPYGFQVPAIGGGWNGTDVEPTVGFVWANIDAFQAAYFEDLSATPADRDRATFRRAFVCAYIPKLADQLTKVSPYRCN